MQLKEGAAEHSQHPKLHSPGEGAAIQEVKRRTRTIQVMEELEFQPWAMIHSLLCAPL